MKGELIYREGDIMLQYVCSCCPPVPYSTPIDLNEKTPIYYSKRQAMDEGWIYTEDSRFCRSFQKGVWICPECIEQLRDEDNE